MCWPSPVGIKIPFVTTVDQNGGVPMSPEAKPRRRKIHVDLPEEVHQKLRVKAALEDVSMQAFVARVVAEAVKGIALPVGGRKTTKGR